MLLTPSVYTATHVQDHIYELILDQEESGTHLDASKIKIHGFAMRFINEVITFIGLAWCYIRRAGRNLAWKWHRTVKFFGPELTKTDEFAKKESSRGLYVLIHGLNNKPSQWHMQLDKLRDQKTEGFDVRAPYVLNKGKCTLDEAVEPIFKMVKSYAENNPGKPIALMGISNGGAIASEIETRLRKEGIGVKILVQSIAGVLCGTERVNIPGSSLVTGRAFGNERAPTSVRQQQMIKDRNDSIKLIDNDSHVTYDMYATPNDLHVKPWTSALPVMPSMMNSHKLSLTANYFVRPGMGHITAPEMVARHQMERALTWMGNNQKSSV